MQAKFKSKNIISLFLIGGLIFFLPYFVSINIISMATAVAVYAIAAFGMVILTGHAGVFNMGFAGFMAVGSYTVAILQSYGIPFYFALLASIFVGCFIGFLVGVVCKRMGLFSIAMVTYGFGILINQLIRTFEDVTGGLSGISVDTMPFLDLYYFVWVFVGIACLIAYLLLKGWVGRSFRAFRDGPIASEFFGLSLSTVKIVSLTISSGFAAVSGAFFVHYIGNITPTAFNIELSLAYIVMIIIGGRYSLWGGLIGSILWVVLPQIFLGVTGMYPIIFGILTIIILLWLPDGIISVIDKFSFTFANRKPVASLKTEE